MRDKETQYVIDFCEFLNQELAATTARACENWQMTGAKSRVAKVALIHAFCLAMITLDVPEEQILTHYKLTLAAREKRSKEQINERIR